MVIYRGRSKQWLTQQLHHTLLRHVQSQLIPSLLFGIQHCEETETLYEHLKVVWVGVRTYVHKKRGSSQRETKSRDHLFPQPRPSVSVSSTRKIGIQEEHPVSPTKLRHWGTSETRQSVSFSTRLEWGSRQCLHQWLFWHPRIVLTLHLI